MRAQVGFGPLDNLAAATRLRPGGADGGETCVPWPDNVYRAAKAWELADLPEWTGKTDRGRRRFTRSEDLRIHWPS